ncbi:hypothetical protein EGW08_019475 [Elysia chlorotica]|uniref:Spaetzle domain-containing protein n=1 Tax=Elysia chlorotica TaxID=188477 RepID=A0A3S1BQY8_ELYCH|nr:hypothetical protein EGW08_019475 [Elysia chlorotica]
MRMIFMIRMMTVLISASPVEPSAASPSASDIDSQHQTSTRHPRDSAHSQRSSATHHAYDSLAKRSLRDEVATQMDFTDSDDEGREDLDLNLGLSTSRGAGDSRSVQSWMDRGVAVRAECCPSQVHMVHPRGGISRDGRLLELYRDHRTVQTFYQTTCLREVHNRPCPLVRHELQRYSRCVQKYSFVYAFVRDFNVSESFRLDYIRLKSGCSCEVELKPPRTRALSYVELLREQRRGQNGF